MTSHQAATLGRHMRNALQGDAKKLYDDVWKEYRRITSDPQPNAIGMLTALLSECLIEWSVRDRGDVGLALPSPKAKRSTGAPS